MRGLHDTITRLSALRDRLPSPLSHASDDRFEEMTGFGSNPGALLARTYLPRTLDAGAPLVVVLHGCTQSASSYNRGASWTSAADEHGFALLFPEQQRANNPNLCFNWFSPADASRDQGEALSIVEMVRAMCLRHSLDPQRVYVTGLSAGGAMTAVMLATYPDVFAGGAVIAGLPFGTATSVPEAFERMRGQSELGSDQLSRLVRSASSHAGKWPTLSVWHGTSDRTVDASNAAALVDQWRGLHRLPEAPTATERVAGQLRRVWRDAGGAEVMEEYVIADMGHGTPIRPMQAEDGEVAGPYMLDVGISSTRRIVRFWNLDANEGRTQIRVPDVAPASPSPAPEQSSAERIVPAPALRDPPGKVQAVIEAALRNAGLMR